VFSAFIWPNFSIVAIGEQSFIAFFVHWLLLSIGWRIFLWASQPQGKITSTKSGAMNFELMKLYVLFALTEINMFLLYKFRSSVR